MSKQLTIELSDKDYENLRGEFLERNQNINLESAVEVKIIEWLTAISINTARDYAKKKVLEQFEQDYIDDTTSIEDVY